MSSVAPSTVPRLAPPGAGLPGMEMLFARLIFHWSRKRTSREQAALNFSLRSAEILSLTANLDAPAGERRVLIPRLRGMEDSSRYWSVFMTLDHLRIVNDSCAGVVNALTAGRVPPRPASTAAVKPAEGIGTLAVAAFRQSCLNFEKTCASPASLATDVKYAHPWFGPLDAGGWHFMAGFHMNLHRKQVESILFRSGDSVHSGP